MAKDKAIKEEVISVQTFDDLRAQAQKDGKSIIQMLANLKEEISSNIKISNFIQDTKEDVEVQIRQLNREIRDNNDKLYNELMTIPQKAKTESGRLDLADNVISLLDKKEKKEGDIVKWNRFLELFEAPKAA